MSEELKNPDKMSVVELKAFLKDRGVVHSGARREELLRLCKLARDTGIEVDPDGQKEDIRRCIKQKLAISEKDYLPSPESVSCTNNLAIIPSISIFDIYNYLVRFSDQFTHSKLRDYKNSDGYKLFLDGHVIALSCGQYFQPYDNYFVIFSKVRPKTRERDPITRLPYYQAWIILQGQSDAICVKSSFCCCKGDAGGCCRHIVATMFEVTEFLNDNRTSVTSKLCQWNPRPCKGSEATEATDICTSATKKVTVPLSSEGFHNIELPSADDFLRAVKLYQPTACILKVFPDVQESSQTFRPVIPTTVFERSKLYFANHSSCDCGDECYSTYLHGITYSTEQREQIEMATRGQSDSTLWHDFHRALITASCMKSVLHSRNLTETANKALAAGRPIINTEPILYGRRCESLARDMFKVHHESQHGPAIYFVPGLYVGIPGYPFIGATPDLMLDCRSCGRRVIEIKCLWKYRNLPAEDALIESQICKREKDGILTVIPSHRYYYQIQTQLILTGASVCLLVGYTDIGIYCVEVGMNKEMCEEMLKKISFYHRTALFHSLKRFSFN